MNESRARTTWGATYRCGPRPLRSIGRSTPREGEFAERGADGRPPGVDERLQQIAVHHGVTQQCLDDAVSDRVGSQVFDPLSPLLLDLDHVVEQMACILQRGERRIGTEFHDRHEVAMSVLGQCFDVTMLLGDDSRRDRQRGRLGQTVSAKECMDQRTADASVAVGERVDRLELSVHDHGLYEHRHVRSVDEPAQVLDRIEDPRHGGRDELGGGRPGGVAADPHGLVPPASGEHGMRVA